MKSDLDHIETQDLAENDNDHEIGRRQFLTGSVSLGAAVLGAGVLAAASPQTAQAADVPTVDWSTLKPGDRANDLYAPQEGFNDTDATWWPRPGPGARSPSSAAWATTRTVAR